MGKWYYFPKKGFVINVRKCKSHKGGMNMEMQTEVRLLPLEDITVNPDQPRKIFHEEELEELTESIRNFGVLQPIIVRQEERGTYTIIAGERRYRAATMAGLKNIPALVKDFDEGDLSLVALVENIQRENLNFLEEARAYKKLMKDFSLTQGEIASKVGKKQSTISNKIRILTLPEDIQESLLSHQLSERHARALLRLEDEGERRKIVERIIKNHLNVKQTEKLIEDYIRSKAEQKKKRNRINYISYKIYVNTIRNAFGQIKEMEKNASMEQYDKGDYLEVVITIPKKDGCFT